ncbi:unnamed protein product [Cylicocyclus nassatus]|nr:unnamed protein product [Cylicocyclus nassatus]
MSASASSLVQLSNVRIDRSGRTILRDVSLQVPKGSITAVLGPSGSGKSTLLAALTGELRPVAGEVTLFGKPIPHDSSALLEMRKSVGVLLQGNGLLTDLTVAENVALPLRTHTRLPAVVLRRLVQMKLHAVGLLAAAEAWPRELSGGMARRVALARALALDPPLMIYDEPLTGLDPIASGVIMSLIQRLNHSLGLTSIIVSHHVHETLPICDQPGPAAAAVPAWPARWPHSVRCRAAREGCLMPFVQATRSLGRAGLFSLTVLRGSLPTRDFLAELTREIYKIGARSLPIIAVGGAFVGLVLTLQGYRTLTTFGAADALSTLLGLSLYRELAPVLTALLFIGRAGSSIAAELGLMRATDQIKALELMAIDPVAKAVAPRFWAAVLTVPLLTGIFCSLAISASYFEAVHVLGLDNGVFWSALRNSVDFWDDFGVAMLKSAIFGGTAALVAAYVGFHAEPTIEGTSVATTRAVVNASLLVLMFNFVLSAMLFT